MGRFYARRAGYREFIETGGIPRRLWLDPTDLADLVSEAGPFVSVVLATEAEIDNASHRNQLRWRALRDSLLEQAPEKMSLPMSTPSWVKPTWGAGRFSW